MEDGAIDMPEVGAEISRPDRAEKKRIACGSGKKC
jgi:hypothetical protein